MTTKGTPESLEIEGPGRMKFRDGYFKILQFTDCHMCFEEEDEKTIRVIEDLISLEDPDLVVLTGDCVSGTSIEKTPEGAKDRKSVV